MAKSIPVSWSIEDKENAAPNIGAREGKGFFAAESKKSGEYPHGNSSSANSSRPRAKGAFGRLLGEVTREQKGEVEQLDEKVAVDTQCREAVALAMEWVAEDADCKMASDMQRQLENEEKLSRQLEVSRGESEALLVAIEERRRLQAEKENKARLEEEDAKRAAQLLEDEEQLRRLIEQDDDYAKRYHETLQDEMIAEELARQEEKSAEIERARLQSITAADAKHAAASALAEMEADRAAAEKQIKADFDLAHAHQLESDKSVKETRAAQERKDYLLARKLAVKAQREDHRRARATELGAKRDSFPTISAVQKQWEECEALVEDVMDGICITLVLPFVRDLKTKACGHNRVELEAYRVVGTAEQSSGSATVDNTQYAAEFIIEGSRLAIQDKDISYEYTSDSGLLHIYIDKVRLDGAPVKDSDPDWREPDKSKIVSSSLRAIKDSFRRLVRGVNGAKAAGGGK